MFSRTIWGARVSLMVGFFSIVAGFLVGGMMGVVSGYRRGWIDLVLGFVTYVMLSFPTLVLFLLVILLFGQGLWIVTAALSIVVIPSVSRLARAITIAFAEREFVAAARLLGATNRRVMAREILPNVLIPMSALLLFGLGLGALAGGDVLDDALVAHHRTVAFAHLRGDGHLDGRSVLFLESDLVVLYKAVLFDGRLEGLPVGGIQICLLGAVRGGKQLLHRVVTQEFHAGRVHIHPAAIAGREIDHVPGIGENPAVIILAVRHLALQQHVLDGRGQNV